MDINEYIGEMVTFGLLLGMLWVSGWSIYFPNQRVFVLSVSLWSFAIVYPIFARFLTKNLRILLVPSVLAWFALMLVPILWEYNLL